MSQYPSDIALENNMDLEHASHRQKALHCKEIGRWEEALAECQHALELNPKDWDIYIVIGDVHYSSGEWAKAATSYAKVLEARPDETTVMHKMAVALSRSGETQKADECYALIFAQQADFEKKHLDNFSIQQQAGDYFFRQQAWVRAVEAYQSAVELEPQACWEHINLGRSLAQIDRSSEAIVALKKAAELDEKNGWAYYYLAEIFLREERLSDALNWCRKAAVLLPEQVEPKTLISEIGSANVRLKRAKAAGQAGASQRSITVSALEGWSESYELGKHFQAEGDLESAVKAYCQSIIKNPQYSWAYHDLGDVHLKMGSWHEAIASYQQALRLSPDYFWSNYNLGVAYRNVGKWQSSVDLYKRSIQLYPGLNLLARALEDTLKAWYDSLMAEGDQSIRHNKAKALSTYRKAVEIYRDNIYVLPFEVTRVCSPNISVLLVVDDHLPQCLRYRVQQKIEQLEYAGFECDYYAWTNVAEAQNKMAFFDVVIFYRTPAFTGVISAIKYAKAVRKAVFYEIDDLIFDSDLFPDPIESYGGQVSEAQYNDLVKGTVLFQEAMRLCDMAIASTPPLLKQMEKVVGEGNCYLHRNALDSKNIASLAIATPKVERDYISIFYGSGTKAHNSDFDEQVAPALVQVLQQHPNVRLTLMGYLIVPDILTPYQDQIDRVGLVTDVLVYYEFLRQADIAIAVLHPTAINNCKSELKWFEAASFKIPAVVSNTEVYLEAIEQGRDGFIASSSEEWFHWLNRLVVDKALRMQVGESAYAKVMKQYSVSAMASNISDIIKDGLARQVASGDIKQPAPNKTGRKRVLIVNVFYPPQSIGGATRVVKDNVDVLMAQYKDDYDISVFTTDNDNPEPYKIVEYSYQGVPVTKVSSPMMEGMDWQYRNPRMYDIFKQYLEFNRPDLIHFHCVQRLTASVLEAAADLEIPYIVTAHDAWWISDHQFLVNAEGVECDYQQNDPVVAARDVNDIAAAIQRRLYLREHLNKAAAVLAVSEAFTELYRRNGFLQTKANRNGIQPQPLVPRVPSESGHVRLAHIGGMAAHKGYFLFKEAVEQGYLLNTEVIVINHAQSAGTVEYDDWNGTPVTFLAKFKQAETGKLYSMIDVLVAPSMWPESFGLVTREAAAAGVWVVTSDKGAIGEDITPGENGHICSVESVAPLARVLKEIDDNAERYKLQRKDIENVRTTQAQVDELSSFYREILM